MKKTFKFLSIFIVSLLVMCSVVSAATVNKGDVTMALVEDNVCHITFGEFGEFDKKLLKLDTTNKVVDISFNVKNKAVKPDDRKADVVLLIDSSRSMSTNQILINGVATTRKRAVLDSAEDLVNKLLAQSPNIKIGVVEFATSTEVNDEGFTIEGTDKDANIVTDTLSNDKTTLETALDKVANTTMGARTNVEVGLDTAYKLLETETDPEVEKYIVVLTDAIPNTSRGVTGDFYTDKTLVPTRNKLLELKDKGVNIISMLINMTDDEIAVSQETPKPTYKQVAQRLFGTTVAPTAGKVYYVTDEEVDNTVSNQIYEDLMPPNYDIDNIVIKDYFPKNIIENFAYAELTKATAGEVTATVNKEDNSITWTIGKLEPGESASFTYRLTLNNDVNGEIIGINLPTNENVVITFEEDGTPGKAENNKCPIVILDALPKKDIPQTGSITGLYVGSLVSVVAILSIASYVYMRKNRF